MPLVVAVDDLLEFKVISTYNNNVQCNNVFHYRVSEFSAATLDQFAAGLWAMIQAEIANNQCNIMNYLAIDAKILDADANLINGETYIVPVGEGHGASSADAMPPFVNYTYRYVRPNAQARHGFKRFAGVPEDAVTDGLLDTSLTTAVNAAAAALAGHVHAFSIDTDGSPLSPLSSDVMLPVVVSKFLNGDRRHPAVINEVSTVVFSGIGSQNTRKFNRGV